MYNGLRPSPIRDRGTGCERELRKLVLGKKLFAWGDIGRQHTANALTIVATCLAHRLNPHAYLHMVTQHLLELDGSPQRKLAQLHPELIARCTAVGRSELQRSSPRQGWENALGSRRQDRPIRLSRTGYAHGTPRDPATRWQGASQRMIATLLGHSNTSATERYTHVQVDATRTLVEARWEGLVGGGK